jgi:hypothetical protein
MDASSDLQYGLLTIQILCPVLSTDEHDFDSKADLTPHAVGSHGRQSKFECKSETSAIGERKTELSGFVDDQTGGPGATVVEWFDDEL